MNQEMIEQTRTDLINLYNKEIEAIDDYLCQEHKPKSFVIELETLFISSEVDRLSWNINPVRTTRFSTREEAERLAGRIKNGNKKTGQVLELEEAAIRIKAELLEMSKQVLQIKG